MAQFLDNEASFASERGVAKLEERFQNVLMATVPPMPEVDIGLEQLPEEDKGIHTALVKKQLDLYIFYLNRVHFYDYYTGIESSSPEDHYRRGTLPIRKAYSPTDPAVNRKVYWITKLDSRVGLRQLKTYDDVMQSMYGFKNLELEVDKTLSLYLRKESDAKFRCTECQKLFRGDDFVRKHIRSKHPNLIAHVAEEVEFFNNFCTDFNKIEIKPPVNAAGYGGRPREDHRDRRIPRDSRGFEGRRSETRPLRSYHDLDAPVDGNIQLKYD